MRHLLVSLRLDQWIKNAFVLAPLVFSMHLFEPATAFRAGALAFLFCLISSAVYLVNDVLDREKDRVHPEKRRRPVAAGLLPPGAAFAAAVGLTGVALGGGFFASPVTGAFLSGYFALNILYTLVFKQVVILDVISIAAGFVLRVWAGAAVISVPASPWLIVCTFLLSSFLGFCKRKQELAVLGSDKALHRAVLADYSAAFVDQLISASASCTVMTYALYTLADETVEKFHTHALLATLPFVVYGVFRYLYHLNVKGDTRSTSQIILSDKSLMAGILLWLCACAAVIYYYA